MTNDPKDQIQAALRLEQETLARKGQLNEALTEADATLIRVRSFLEGVKTGMALPAETAATPEAVEA